MVVAVKICGITTEEAMEAALDGRAAYVGVVFHPTSPRAVDEDRAAELLDFIAEETRKVGLFVDPDDATLERVLTRCRLDMIQLHGHESAERIEAIRLEYGLPVMKAIPVAELADIANAVVTYGDVADWLLLDAKPPAGAERTGGNAVSFDWTLPALWRTQSSRRWPVPWMLAGGLTPENLPQAVSQSKACVVDVSSGVEDTPGHKSPEKIMAFLKAAEAL